MALVIDDTWGTKVDWSKILFFDLQSTSYMNSQSLYLPETKSYVIIFSGNRSVALSIKLIRKCLITMYAIIVFIIEVILWLICNDFSLLKTRH